MCRWDSISDLRRACATKEAFIAELMGLQRRSRLIERGIESRGKTVMEAAYIASLRSPEESTLMLGNWLPALGVRPLAPGDLLGIVADNNAQKGPTRSHRRKRQRQRNETAREFLAWMPPLRHWPRNPEPLKDEDSEIFNWMLENPMIVEALDGLEGAERYKALHGMLDSARAKGVIRFNKETREAAGAALYQRWADTNRFLSQRGRPKS
jgi:hypothetical protein